MSHKFIVSAIAANEVSEHVQQLQSVYSCSDLSAKGQGTVSERQLASCAQWFPVGFMAAFVLKQIICVDNPSQWLQNYRFLIRLSLPNCQIQHFLVCLKLGHSHVMKKWWSIKLHQIYQKFSNHFQTKPTFPFLSKGFFFPQSRHLRAVRASSSPSPLRSAPGIPLWWCIGTSSPHGVTTVTEIKHGTHKKQFKVISRWYPAW